MIEAKVICDSIGDHSPRLTTFWCKYPKFIHAEHMRHRTGSYCVSSSRAIPVSRNLEEVRSDALRAAPIWWGREQKGMTSGEELTDEYDPTWSGSPRLTFAQREWKDAAISATIHATQLMNVGAHKSIVNRILEPFLHVNVLWTTCEPGLLNFFGLRLDKAAQPEIRALAEAVWRAWNESMLCKLTTGEWHLPFITAKDDAAAGWALINNASQLKDIEGHNELAVLQRISVARCARLSYTSFETGKRSTIEEDLALYERLVGSHPIHASPAEHQCTPDEWVQSWHDNYGPDMAWRHREQHGNMPGWRQLRKMLANEAIAPLPKEYQK